MSPRRFQIAVLFGLATLLILGIAVIASVLPKRAVPEAEVRSREPFIPWPKTSHPSGWSELRTLKAHEVGGITDVAFAPAGTHLATASAESVAINDEERPNYIKRIDWSGQVILWDSASGEIVFNSGIVDRGFKRLAFSEDGKTLFAAANEGTVYEWTVPNGELRATHNPGGVVDGMVLNGGRTMAWIDGEGMIRAVDFTGETERMSLKFKVPFDRDYWAPVSFELSSSRRYCAVSYRGECGLVGAPAKLWDLNDGSLVAVLANGHHSYRFSPAGEALASFCGEGATLVLWHLASQQEATTLQTNGSWIDAAIAFTQDGSIVAGSFPEGILLWNAANGQHKASLVERANRWASAMAFSSDKLTLAVGTEEGLVKLWTVPGRIVDPLVGKEVSTVREVVAKSGSRGCCHPRPPHHPACGSAQGGSR